LGRKVERLIALQGDAVNQKVSGSRQLFQKVVSKGKVANIRSGALGRTGR